MNINIHNLIAIGSDLFTDPESYLQDLSDLELHVQGGAEDSKQPILTITTFQEPILTITTLRL